jgi:hypothetical protein
MERRGEHGVRDQSRGSRWAKIFLFAAQKTMLRELHLGQKRRRSSQPPRHSVLKRPNDAYEAERAKNSGRSRRMADG